MDPFTGEDRHHPSLRRTGKGIGYRIVGGVLEMC